MHWYYSGTETASGGVVVSADLCANNIIRYMHVISGAFAGTRAYFTWPAGLPFPGGRTSFRFEHGRVDKHVNAMSTAGRMPIPTTTLSLAVDDGDGIQDSEIEY